MPNWVLIVIIVLVVLWLLGMITSVLGGWLHVLLIIALIFLIIWFVQQVGSRKIRSDRR